MAKEDAFWRQQTNINWLKKDDRNSKFFHVMISARRKQNHISKLQRSDDEFVDEQVELCGVAELYFDDLFTSSTGNIQPHN